MIYTTPGATFSSRVDGLPTGLAGTLGVQILDSTGAVATARATAGISENPAGSGSYLARLTAPSSVGQYAVFWDEGTIGPSTTTSEALVVTYTPPTPGGSGSDLCTLADVRLQMETEAYDTDLDSLILAQIPEASRALMDDAQREYAPATASATRRIDVRGYQVDLAPYDLRSASAVVFDPDVSAITLTPHVDYELLPIGGDRDGVYTEIKISRFRTLQSQKWQAFGHADIAVTGAWGFTAVPTSVKRACVVAVCAWVRRDLATYAQLDPEVRAQQPPTPGTYALPRGAISLLDGTRRYPRGMAVG